MTRRKHHCVTKKESNKAGEEGDEHGSVVQCIIYEKWERKLPVLLQNVTTDMLSCIRKIYYSNMVQG